MKKKASEKTIVFGSHKLSEIDEKIKAWIAGPEEKEIFQPALPYEKKLVAFIDILGVKH